MYAARGGGDEKTAAGNVAAGVRNFSIMNEKIRTEKGEYDMCKAIRGMIDDGKKEGIKIGEQRGVRRGKRQAKHDMINQYIAVCKKDGNGPEQIKEQLMKYFFLSMKQAESYVSRSGGMQK